MVLIDPLAQKEQASISTALGVGSTAVISAAGLVNATSTGGILTTTAGTFVISHDGLGIEGTRSAYSPSGGIVLTCHDIAGVATEAALPRMGMPYVASSPAQTLYSPFVGVLGADIGETRLSSDSTTRINSGGPIIPPRPPQGVPPSQPIPPEVEELIKHKHAEYLRASNVYSFLYYGLRLIAALCAGLLPFVVGSSPLVATGLSIAIVVATALDLVFNPKNKWQIFSKASDMLTISTLKLRGDYTQYSELLQILASTEAAKLEQLVSLEAVVAAVRSQKP